MIHFLKNRELTDKNGTVPAVITHSCSLGAGGWITCNWLACFVANPPCIPSGPKINGFFICKIIISNKFHSIKTCKICFTVSHRHLRLSSHRRLIYCLVPDSLWSGIWIAKKRQKLPFHCCQRDLRL